MWAARRSIAVDVRWVAASNRNLEQMVDAGSFREDLYHRLAVFPIMLPPLRKRPEDIVPLARYLIGKIAADLGRPPLSLSADAAAKLTAAHWRGNVRELANALERAAILAEGDVLHAKDFMLGSRPPPASEAGAASRAHTSTTWSAWRSRQRWTPIKVTAAAPPSNSASRCARSTTN